MYSPNSAYFVPVQLIVDVNVDIPIDIDVTAIIPIDIEIENAQICANLGGTQTCQINNISPVTYEFEPTTIDLASQELTLTTQPTTSTAPTTTEPTTSTPTEPATEDNTTSTDDIQADTVEAMIHLVNFS